MSSQVRRQMTLYWADQGRGYGYGVPIAAGFLALSYGLGAPWAAYVEYSTPGLSSHFGLPVWFIYAVCSLQIFSALGVLWRATAFWSASLLTVTTLGAIAVHLKVAEPLSAIPAVLYTALQIWFATRIRAANLRAEG
ncbi:MAG TPA: DoxX family protein [Acidobacteriota bacterium]|nr:DoxX family protein [Acidobacteriota bacterium]